MNPLFIHVPKVAGKAIKKTLDGVCDYATFDHFKLKEITSWDSYFSFAFVRNPYHRLLSSYYFYKDVYPGRRSIRKEISKYKDFRDFCKNFKSFSFKTDLQFHTQFSFIEVQGEIKIDFLGRYESLEYDWKRLSDVLNFDTPLLEDNLSPNRNDISEYDQDSIDLANMLFEDDFKYLGYDKLQ